MATYAIGDVHGCLSTLQALLTQIHFKPEQDALWFVGDLVNRGPRSLETIRFVMKLPNTVVVLGNHDLTLLAIGYGHLPYDPHDFTCQDILEAPDCPEILNWLRHRPLLHFDPHLQTILVHAGLPPNWDLTQAQQLAHEAEHCLQGPEGPKFLAQALSHAPLQWHNDLQGWERIRCIINILTRIRFCTPDGLMDFQAKGPANAAPTGYFPWFDLPRPTQSMRTLFGHWSALRGITALPEVIAMDTGCVWGESLSAMRLEDGQRFAVPS